jgi:3-phenylpropionate/cinnamic acid dioxygenase small subunit
MAASSAQDREHALDRLLLVREIEEFLYYEAELLDTRHYDEWLTLLTEDIRYWMPIARNVEYGQQAEHEYTRELHDVNWIDEGKHTLSQRVEQISTGIHWAEEPLSRTSHMVSNVDLLKVKGNEVTVKCRFLVYRNRQQAETDFFVGKREDTLRRVDGQWKVARRKVILDQNVLLAKNLTILF